MLPAASTSKNVSRGALRPKRVWHPECPTEVGLGPQCATHVCLATPMGDLAPTQVGLALPVRDTIWSGTPRARLKSD